MSSRLESLSGFDYWRAATRETSRSWRSSLRTNLGRNVAAGVTVALVALPLNLALALACDLPAVVGLITGAIAGVLGAVLGGSRLQITGPEVALAPITFEIVSRHGIEGLVLATMLAGIMQIALGLLRVGGLMRAIPLPVIGGFLAAVGILVFDTQLPRLLGLPADIRLVSEITLDSLRTIQIEAVGVGVVVIAAMVLLPKIHERIPGPLVALGLAIAALALGFTLPTVAPFDATWPAPRLPNLAGVDLVALLPEAIALAIIASIDSLLCAVSVDRRVRGRTRTDQELVAQGLANIGSACFGGMPVAAAVVRSVAAIEAGATSRIAPLVQSLVLALIVLVLAPLVTYVPLVALAAILLVVGWRLIDFRLLWQLWQHARYESVIFLVTALGILLTDFVVGVLIGVAAALAHFAHEQREFVSAASLEAAPTTMEIATATGRAQVIWLAGPLFFGSQTKLVEVVDQIRPDIHDVVLELSGVPTIDTSGAGALVSAIERLAARDDMRVWVSGIAERSAPLVEFLMPVDVADIHLVASIDEVGLGAQLDAVAGPTVALDRSPLSPRSEDTSHATAYVGPKCAASKP